MVFELILVAAVVALVGLAVYQANHRTTPITAVTTSGTPAPSSASASVAPTSAQGLAAAAAATALDASAQDASLSASSQSSASQLSQSDTDVSNLGGTSNASF
jgi:hypothetical protein